jgi:hypothetical protein
LARDGLSGWIHIMAIQGFDYIAIPVQRIFDDEVIVGPIRNSSVTDVSFRSVGFALSTA